MEGCLECKKTISITEAFNYTVKLHRDCAIKMSKCQHCAIKPIYQHTVLCKSCIYDIYDKCEKCSGPSIQGACIDHNH